MYKSVLMMMLSWWGRLPCAERERERERESWVELGGLVSFHFNEMNPPNPNPMVFGQAVSILTKENFYIDHPPLLCAVWTRQTHRSLIFCFLGFVPNIPIASTIQCHFVNSVRDSILVCSLFFFYIRLFLFCGFMAADPFQIFIK